MSIYAVVDEYCEYYKDLQILNKNEVITGFYKKHEYGIYRTNEGNLVGYVKVSSKYKFLSELRQVHGNYKVKNDTLGHKFVCFGTYETNDLILPNGTVGFYRGVQFVRSKLIELIDQIVFLTNKYILNVYNYYVYDKFGNSIKIN